MEKPYNESSISDFMMRRQRRNPLSFTAPVQINWRPSTVPLLVISDDEDDFKLPQYAVTKVTHPSSSRDPKSELAQTLLRINNVKNFLDVVYVSFSDSHKRTYGPMPLEASPQGMKQIFAP